MSIERKLVRLTEVEEKKTEWLWEGYLPAGVITDLSGDPAQAKSRIAYDLIARVTSGRPMPDNSPGAPPAGVVLLQGEDSVAGIVKPALAAAGAHPNRVFVYDPGSFKGSPLELPDDLDLVKSAVKDVQAKLLVIDPAASFFTCNANSDQSVRKALLPLEALARKNGLAVLIVRHLNKGRSGNLLYRASGSIQWIAAARSALRVIDHPISTAPHSHLLVQIKTNLVSAPSLNYRTVLDNGVVSVEWLGPNSITARDLASGGEEETKLWEAMEILFLILGEGPHSASVVYDRAKDEGVSRRTLERAKKALRVKSGRQKNNYRWWWEWRLPDENNEILAFLRDKYDALDNPQASPPVVETIS